MQKMDDEALGKLIERFVAAVNGVSVEELTPELLEKKDAERMARRRKEAEAKGYKVLTVEDVKRLAASFRSRKGDREKILSLD